MNADRTPAAPLQTPRPVAVVELGSTSIRMAIAEITGVGTFRLLDSLQQAVSLGKDTFTGGSIAKSTMEDCAAALRRFRHVLREYRIHESRDTRAVATSAVREAANQRDFLDRILIATDLVVEVIDPAEVSRLTYLAVRPLLEKQKWFRKADTIVVEVGGGSTESLTFRQGKVANAHMYRLGSLRMHKMLSELRLSQSRATEIMRNEVDETVEQIVANLPRPAGVRLLALGGDARFACAQLAADSRGPAPPSIPVPELRKRVHRILSLSTDDVVREYGLTYQDAETVGVSLLVYERLASRLRLKTILVGEASLRDGMLAEMAIGGHWTAEFRRQIVHSAIAIGKRYAIDLRHARNVMKAAQELFEALREEHRLDERYEVILTVAALLHETGMFISSSGHHKHSMYLILNSEIFGLGRRDLLITALVARYHRRAAPKPTHELYETLSREDRIVVAKLASILRVANALDRSRSGHRLNLKVAVEEGSVVIARRGMGDIGMDRIRLDERSEMFRHVFGMDVILRGAEGSRHDGRK